MDVLKLLLYLLLFVFPLGAVIRVNILKSAYLYPTDIVSSFVLLTTIYLIYKTKRLPFTLPLFKPVILFVVFAFLSLIFNLSNLSLEHFFISFLYLIRFVLYAQLLFVFHYLPRSFSKNYLVLLSVSGFIVVTLGLIQYFYYPYLGNLYYLGWDEHYFRIFSTFLDPNFAGALFVLEFLLLLGLLQSENMRIRMKRYFCVIALSFTTVAIFLTYSRNSFIMFLASVMFYFVLTKQKKIIFIFLLMFLLGIILIPKKLSSEGVDLLRTASIFAREEAYGHAITIFRDSPIFGAGFNAYRYAQKRYGFLETKTWEISHSGAGVANSFLFVLATTGVVGFLLYVNFWYRILIAIRTDLVQGLSLKKDLYFKSAVIASIFGVFVHSLFENTLFYPFIMLWIFSLIGAVTAGKTA